MEWFTLLMIALGLSMDAFAVSVSNGMCYSNIDKKQVVITALTFGAFQAAMPVAGYFIGSTVSGLISFLDHWIALIILGVIGGKMIFEALKELKCPSEKPECRRYTVRTLLVQGVATSIDALAVGISFALMATNIVTAALFIGCVTFLCCLFGAYLGKKFGLLLRQKAEIFGGAVLILIGVKIFVEHMLSGS
jgi:putative Mn2+ efflux pump MntP